MPDDREGAELCGFVMQGYTVLVAELLDQLAERREAISHVFVQAGVGGLAASIFGHWTARGSSGSLPRFVVVEPDRAACLLASARAGDLTHIPEASPTIMAMLECQSPSPLAWPVVRKLASAFVSVRDEEARAAVRQLAKPRDGDPALEVGESGAAAGRAHALYRGAGLAKKPPIGSQRSRACHRNSDRTASRKNAGIYFPGTLSLRQEPAWRHYDTVPNGRATHSRALGQSRVACLAPSDRDAAGHWQAQ